MKKTFAILLSGMLMLGALTGCSGDNTDNAGSNDASTVSQEQNAVTGAITVVSREEGSGTRGAFIELFGIEEKDESGEKIDRTTDTAEITDKTSVMMTTVAGNPRAIGYISLGSLNDTVKALEIDGAAASVENIKSGSYKVSRPFNIATKGEATGIVKDFIGFIMSTNGQQVVADNGYIPLDATESYSGSGVSGTITVGGSSSVSPVMEKLIEAYKVINPGVTIELQTTDSTTGMTDAINGTVDIGMASRELKDSETSKGLVSSVIATDGIAVIVNNENSVSGMTSEQVKSIFVGETTDWSALNS